MTHIKRIAILGGGPSGLFLFKRLIDYGQTDISIDIFEKKHQLGAGLPYSTDGANQEHITNVSGNEIPALETSLTEWMQTVPQVTLEKFDIDINRFNDYKVLPRLLFGQYLSTQFDLLEMKAKKAGITISIHRKTIVTDIIDDAMQKTVTVLTLKGQPVAFHHVIICTGHRWPVQYEGIIEGYFDSPYPPSKLATKINHAVAIKGSSLTAIDAIKTLTRCNGEFIKDNDDNVSFKLADDSKDFKIIMHTRNGFLPAVRFHLDDPHLSKDSVLSNEEIESNRKNNKGFFSLDLVFDKNFKEPVKAKDPVFYEKIKKMRLEEFVAFIMNLRESVDAFDLYKGEYIEAEKSIRRKESVYWKEMLAVLSFDINYPAKYFSAEDTLRLQKVLMPLISLVIAFVPQSSVAEMLTLHKAGLLELISVNGDSYVEPCKEGGIVYHYTDDNNKSQSKHYKTYIDCTGQPHFSYKDLPFKSLVDKKTVSPAKIKFRDSSIGIQEKENGNKDVTVNKHGDYYLNVPGIAIDDNFRVVDEDGISNERIFMMAVPYIGGYNPDYSGLDFCEAASKLIAESIFKD